MILREMGVPDSTFENMLDEDLAEVIVGMSSRYCSDKQVRKKYLTEILVLESILQIKALGNAKDTEKVKEFLEKKAEFHGKAKICFEMVKE